MLFVLNINGTKTNATQKNFYFFNDVEYEIQSLHKTTNYH
jgi:hypothetical protein